MPTATPGWPATRRRSIVARSALYLGALAVVATGVVHIQQYSAQDYSTIPTIGTLFLLNFVSAVVIALGLVAPYRRIAGRHADAIRAALADRRYRSCRPLAHRLVRVGVDEPVQLPRERLPHADRAGDRGGGRRHGVLLVFLAANGTGLAKIRGLWTRPA